MGTPKGMFTTARSAASPPASPTTILSLMPVTASLVIARWGYLASTRGVIWSNTALSLTPRDHTLTGTLCAPAAG